MDRDAVLVAALGAAVLSGCTSPSRPAPTPSPTTPTPEPVDPDIAVLQGWYAAESAMAARYPGKLVPPFEDAHRAHLSDIGDHLRVRGEPPPPVPSVAPYRGTRASLLKTLAQRESELGTRYRGDITAVRDVKVAVLGAELSASARQMAAVLRIQKP